MGGPGRDWGGGGRPPAKENEKRGKPVRRGDGLVQVIDGDERRHGHAAAHHGLHDADGRVRESDQRESTAADVPDDAEEPLPVGEIGGDG